MRTDAELLRCYATEKSEDAFAELVHRHLDSIHSAALRQTLGDASLAEEITQEAFTLLARKAGALLDHPVLLGWLFRTVRFRAVDAMRATARRLHNQKEAGMMPAPMDNTAADWNEIRPFIDEALGKLNETDRNAVLLRFFEGRGFDEIGTRLHLSGNAARMRVDRALEKLRAQLTRHGITSTTAALAFMLPQHAVSAAPACFATTVSATAIASAAAQGGLAGVSFFMSLSKIKIAAASLLTIGAVTGLIFQHNENAQLRAELTHLRSETPASSRQPALTTPSLTTGPLNTTTPPAPLEVASRPDPATSPPANFSASGAPAPTMIAIEGATSPGNATPIGAYISMASAILRTDVDAASNLITFEPGGRASLEAYFSSLPEATRVEYGRAEKLFATVLAGTLRDIRPFEIVSRTVHTPDEESFVFYGVNRQGIGGRETFLFRRTPDGWKVVFSDKLVNGAVNTLRSKR